MTRKYFILYKREGSQAFSKLEPGVHVPLYAKPEIKEAISFMETYQYVEGISLRPEPGNAMYNIIATEHGNFDASTWS